MCVCSVRQYSRWGLSPLPHRSTKWAWSLWNACNRKHDLGRLDAADDDDNSNNRNVARVRDMITHNVTVRPKRRHCSLGLIWEVIQLFIDINFYMWLTSHCIIFKFTRRLSLSLAMDESQSRRRRWRIFSSFCLRIMGWISTFAERRICIILNRNYPCFMSKD